MAKNKETKMLDDLDHERERMHIQMLSSVSHDLKTPLASIVGCLEIYERMKHKLSEEKKDNLIKSALSEAHRLDRFITSILDMNRLENKLVAPQPAEINIQTLLKECLIKLSPVIEGNPFVIEGDQTLTAVVDSGLLMRALSCLIENAYLHGSSQPPLVRVSFQQAGEFLSFLVQDNGQGITGDRRHKIFEKYTRYLLKDHKNAGIGLGLPIVKTIASLLQGDVTLLPTDKGACFELKIKNLTVL